MQDVCCTTTPSCQRGAQTPPPCWIPPLCGASRHRAGVRAMQRVAVASPVRAFVPRHPDQPSAGWTRASLIAAGLRPAFAKASAGMPGSLRRSPVPIEQGGDFALPLHPHRPTLRGLDAASLVAAGSRPGRFPLAPEPHRAKGAALGEPAISRTTTARAATTFGLADAVRRATRSRYVLVVLKKGAALRPVGRRRSRPRRPRSRSRDPASCRRGLRRAGHAHTGGLRGARRARSPRHEARCFPAVSGGPCRPRSAGAAGGRAQGALRDRAGTRRRFCAKPVNLRLTSIVRNAMVSRR